MVGWPSTPMGNTLPTPLESKVDEGAALYTLPRSVLICIIHGLAASLACARDSASTSFLQPASPARLGLLKKTERLFGKWAYAWDCRLARVCLTTWVYRLAGKVRALLSAGPLGGGLEPKLP